MRFFIIILILQINILSLAQTSSTKCFQAKYKHILLKSLYSSEPDKKIIYQQYFNSRGYTYQVEQNYTMAQLEAQSTTQAEKDALKFVGEEILEKLNKPSVTIYDASNTYYITTNANFENKYCTKTLSDEINWQLLPDTCTVLGFLCHKATCKAAILNSDELTPFEAWYTPTIALPYGPFKLKGLPGLILKANTKYYSYELIELSIVTEQEAEKKFMLCKDKEITTSDKLQQESIKLLPTKPHQ